jgi:hypothetical protein
MKAYVVEKKTQLSLFNIVRYQINFYCFVNDIRLSPAQLDTLAYLGLWGEMNISDFCEEVVKQEVFTNPQTARNFLIKCVKDKLVIRKGLGNKIVELADVFELVNSGTIVINSKIYHVQES